jgi:hypothetical protein
MNVYFHEVLPPYNLGLPPSAGTLDGQTYTYLLDGRQFMMNSLKMAGGDTMYVSRDSTLYVTGDIDLSGNASIVIAPGARLILYAGGKTSLTGNGVSNQTGNALNFVYFGTRTNSELKLGGNADFVGLVYAPKAMLTLVGGGGSTVFDMVGATVSASVKMTGNFSFHYDENVGRSDWSRGFVINSWKEL